MKKIVASAFLSAAIATGLFLTQNKPDAKASYVPPSTICFYSNSGYSYLCPPKSANPTSIIGGTSGIGATTFNNSVGMNPHLEQVDSGKINNYVATLKYMNIHHIRQSFGLLASSSTTDTYIDLMGSNGIKTDLIADSSENNSTTISNNLAYINAAQDVDAIEGPNELNIGTGESNTNWQSKNLATMQALWAWRNANQPSWHVFGPSLAGSNVCSDNASQGDLSAYEDFGNIHPYQAGFYPEESGYGGAVCGYGYGSLDYSYASARQSSVSKPIIVTEFGYQTIPSSNNNVDPGAQAEYTIRQILGQLQRGSIYNYIYDLLDTGGEHYGIKGTTITGAEKIAYSEFAGFMNILNDAGTSNSSCTVPASVSTSGVSSYAICFSDGRYALVLWQPVASWVPNPNQGSYNTVAPINAAIQYSPNFQPSSVGMWSYPLNGQWSFANAPSTYPVTTRPSVVIFNGSASPTPLPTAPPET